MEYRSVAKNDVCRLFVGNMSSQMSESELRQMVEPFGVVKNINLSHGFAFVEMSDEQAAKRVIAALDGREIEGRNLKVRLRF